MMFSRECVGLAATAPSPGEMCLMSDSFGRQTPIRKRGVGVVVGVGVGVPVLRRSWSEAKRTKSAILRSFFRGIYKVIEHIFECHGVSHYALKSFSSTGAL